MPTPAPRYEHHPSGRGPSDHGHGPSSHSHGHGHGHDSDDLALAELLELDARVLPFTTPILERVAHALTRPPARIVDLGAGSGTGTLQLTSRFPTATVSAVDRSPVMVHRLKETLQQAGLAARASAVRADVDSTWTSPEPLDLVWACAVLHEVADPAGVMTAVRGALRPGGLFAVVEMDAPPRFLPENAGFGEAGLEERLHAALATSGGLPPHPRWAPALVAAGFVDITEQQVSLEVVEPLALIQRFATAYFTRIAPALPGQVSAEDLRLLHELIAGDGPRALAARDDLTVRASRTLWTARRP